MVHVPLSAASGASASTQVDKLHFQLSRLGRGGAPGEEDPPSGRATSFKVQGSAEWFDVADNLRIPLRLTVT